MIRRAIVPISLALALCGCTSLSVPDTYGIYADTDCGRLRLNGQVLNVRGNLLEPLPGLDGPSGAECKNLSNFIVFQKGVPPDQIQVSRLDFQESADVRGILRPTRQSVNLWRPVEQIPLDIKPVSDHPDMYRIYPRKALPKGFYALHLGSFGANVPLGVQEFVFDVVVGAAKDFPSHATTVQTRAQTLNDNAAALLKRMNEMFNLQDYKDLGDVYRPGGGVLSGAALDEFLAGNRMWHGKAGKIVKSTLSRITASNDGKVGQCVMLTTYAGIGQQTETMVVTAINDKYFITEMK